MKAQLDTDVLKHYLILATGAQGDARSEIEDACNSLGLQIDNINFRLRDLEKSSKRTADMASCLANGIQPD